MIPKPKRVLSADYIKFIRSKPCLIGAWSGDSNADEFFNGLLAEVRIWSSARSGIPGGGKTMAALDAASRFLAAGSDRRLLIVVPTDNLKAQWRDEAVNFGIHLQTKEFGIDFKDGFTGGVTTYQSLDTNAQLFRKICGTRPTLVILDEPHHCADRTDSRWGTRVKDAFSLARRMLLLSGTPFRTDGTPIPFVSYDVDGYSIAHKSYDYPRAIQEGVVRLLKFDYSSGEYELRESGEIRNYEVNPEVGESERAERLRNILNPDGAWVKEQISKSNARLREVRDVVPDAAAIAICMDQFHARGVADVIRNVTGSNPSIIVSDDEIRTDSIKQFRTAKSPWLVSVRQVTEGTDIKRLQVLCYLTNYATEIFFRQAVGRISRVRWSEKDLEAGKVTNEALDADRDAYVFLPADRQLITFAKRIEDAQVQAIREEEEREGQARERAESIFQRDVEFVSSSHHGTFTVIIGGREYSADDADAIADIMSRIGVSTDKAVRFFEEFLKGREYRTKHRTVEQSTPREKSREEIIDELRRKCNKKANSAAYILKSHPQDIHMRFKRQKDMTVDELRQKLATLSQWCRGGHD